MRFLIVGSSVGCEVIGRTWSWSRSLHSICSREGNDVCLKIGRGKGRETNAVSGCVLAGHCFPV